MKRYLKPVIVALLLIIVGAGFARHLVAQKDQAFSDCNEQAINAVSAHRARGEKTFDRGIESAIQPIFDDTCMSERGYVVSMRAPMASCSGSRAAQCYSHRWMPF
jgi:hypothetical protein